MTSRHALQLAAALISTLTPLVVVAVVYAVAARQTRAGARPLPWPPIARRLAWFTLLIAAATAVAALMLPAPSLAAGAASLGAFVVLAVPALMALAAIDAASRPSREVEATTRQATLATRRPGDYLAWSWRAVAYALAMFGLAAWVWRATFPAAGREWTVSASFAVATAAFVFLYEVWVHDVITGPGIGADSDAARRRTARRLLQVELVLLCVCLAGAHLTLNLDWRTHGVAGAVVAFAGAVVAVPGCALALASGVAGRRYAHLTS